MEASSFLKERWQKATAVGVGLIAVVSSVVLSSCGSGDSETAKAVVSGEVKCASGSPVVGVWVEAQKGESGWATWHPANSANSASFSYQLTEGKDYEVHVGCGGTPENWATSNYSPVVGANKAAHFVCQDVADKPQFAKCTA